MLTTIYIRKDQIKMSDYDRIVNQYYSWLSDKLGMKADIDVLEKLIEEGNGKLPEEYTLGRYLDTLLPNINK